MDENTIGFKKLPDPKWIPCPDHETKKFSWFDKWILPPKTLNQCIHARCCENYEDDEIYGTCSAGYWK